MSIRLHLPGRWIFCALLLAALLLACSSTAADAPPNTPAPTPLVDNPPGPTPLPSEPALPGPTPGPTEVVPLGPTSTPASPAGSQLIQVYWIALEDNGLAGLLVGCGDSAVPVSVEIPPTQGVLRAALEYLLAQKEAYYGQSGLYNALYQSDLAVDDVLIVDGAAAIYLTGSLLQGGECDAPRIQAQLEQTALQFSTVQSVSIFINEVPLDEVLSLQGP